MSDLPGSAVWAVLGALLLAGLAASALWRRRLPTLASVVRWWLDCWLGRIILLAAWAEVGFHVFGQRP